MAGKLRTVLAAASLIFVLACNRDSFEAIPPAYLSIPAIQLVVEPQNARALGSAHSDITTAWVYVNGEPVGVFELPAVVPIAASGSKEVEIYPGITMNGINATRAIYVPYQVLKENVELKALDTVSLQDYTTRYTPSASVSIIEDFDQSGLNLSPTNRSDTSVFKTNDSTEIFVNPVQDEDNGKAGKVVLDSERSFFELATTESYSLPITGQSIYLEMTYKTEVPIIVGVIAKSPLGDVQASTLGLRPVDEWNKVYVNLITEVLAYPDANSFQIYIAGEMPGNLQTATILLDNLKIVY